MIREVPHLGWPPINESPDMIKLVLHIVVQNCQLTLFIVEKLPVWSGIQVAITRIVFKEYFMTKKDLSLKVQCKSLFSTKIASYIMNMFLMIKLWMPHSMWTFCNSSGASGIYTLSCIGWDNGSCCMTTSLLTV